MILLIFCCVCRNNLLRCCGCGNRMLSASQHSVEKRNRDGWAPRVTASQKSWSASASSLIGDEWQRYRSGFLWPDKTHAGRIAATVERNLPARKPAFRPARNSAAGGSRGRSCTGEIWGRCTGDAGFGEWRCTGDASHFWSCMGGDAGEM